MEVLRLNQRDYHVKPGDFTLKPHAEYNNLRIYPKVGELERIAGLLSDLAEEEPSPTLAVYHWSAGGFVPIQCAKWYHEVTVFPQVGETPADPYLPTNLTLCYDPTPPAHIASAPLAIYVDYLPEENWVDAHYHERLYEMIHIQNQATKQAYILCHKTVRLPTTEYNRIPVINTNLVLFVPVAKQAAFMERFRYYFDDEVNFYYDNLIHLCIMVKNAGPLLLHSQKKHTCKL